MSRANSPRPRGRSVPSTSVTIYTDFYICYLKGECRWKASLPQGLTLVTCIEPFEISSNVALAVPTGCIVALGPLDQITKLKASARLLKTQKSHLAGAWAQEASITIPEAGLPLK